SLSSTYPWRASSLPGIRKLLHHTEMTSTTAQPPAAFADTVILGASQLVVCDPSRPDGIGVVEEGCLAISGDTIAAVGTRAEIEALKGPGTRVIDAKGGTVTPGLIDCHTHLIFE